MNGSLREGFTTMIHLTCHVCDSEMFADRLETAELAGWVRAVAGWICESYDCYQSCPHPRLGLHHSAAGAACDVAAQGVG